MPETTDQLVRLRAAEHGTKPMVIDPAGRLSYRELEATTRDLAAACIEAGIAKGTRVGLIMPNGVRWVQVARAVMVVTEFALALVLLVAAALLVQSFWRLQRANLGFRPESVLTVHLWLSQPNDPSSGPYFTHQARVNFYKRVLDRVTMLPGVQAVGGVSALPLTGSRPHNSFVIEGRSLKR